MRGSEKMSRRDNTGENSQQIKLFLPKRKKETYYRTHHGCKTTIVQMVQRTQTKEVITFPLSKMMKWKFPQKKQFWSIVDEISVKKHNNNKSAGSSWRST